MEDWTQARICHLMKRLQTYSPAAARAELKRLRSELQQRGLRDDWLPNTLDGYGRLDAPELQVERVALPGPKKQRGQCRSHPRIIWSDMDHVPLCEECGYAQDVAIEIHDNRTYR
jgi:hypothetical protein